MILAHESSNPLAFKEKELFNSHIKELGLDENIWDIYEKFLQVSSKYSTPRIIRIQRKNALLAHIYLMRSTDHGATISRLWIVRFLMKLIGLPVYSWMKSGIGAENFANPAYINKKDKHPVKIDTIIQVLKRKLFLLFILDFTEKAGQYPGSVVLPYTDEGIVDASVYSSIDEYREQHRNLKKKFREYRNHGGRIDIKTGRLSSIEQDQVEKSVLSTSKKSIFVLPYQDIYPAMCKASVDIDNSGIVHFLCRSDGQFYGYHSFIRFGNQMRCLNGAFNRDLRSTYHAYENMIYKVIEFAIENDIQTVYFGPVLNETKKRMMNVFKPTNLFVYSKYPLILRLFAPILKKSRLTNKSMQKFIGI